MQTFISPIGFNTTSVTRTLLAHGLSNNDSVKLIRPAIETDDDRAAEAVADVEQLLQEIKPNITVSVTEIPHDDFATGVMMCSDLLVEAPDEIVVSLSGGARDILLPLTVATMVHSDDIQTVYGYSDIDGQARELDLPSVTDVLSDGAHQTLTTVADADKSISIPELTTRLDGVKSTITRHINTLENIGYVTSRTENRTKYVSITLSGKLYLATY